MSEIILFLSVFAGTYFGVAIFRIWSLKNNIVDVPNERSSHTMPTPRGGGLIIVLGSLFAYIVSSKITGRNFSGTYLIASSAIALISWLDDLLNISFVWRFLIQAAAAITIILALGYFRQIYVPLFGIINLQGFGAILTFVWIVWLTNAFNFMDGIDGLASIQAVIAGIGWLIIGKIAGLDGAAMLGGMLAFSSFGFLLHNWQPAKVFMGDVGSAFLGFSFAVLPLIAERDVAPENSILSFLPGISIIVVWLFIFDTVLTFSRRLSRGEKVWRAHREHIYQKLVIYGFSHQFVSILYGFLSLVTILIMIVEMNAGNNFSSVLFLFLILQSAGILILLRFKTKRKNISDNLEHKV